MDPTASLDDRVRFHAEYARRTNDLFAFGAGVDRQDLRGLLLEGELRIWSRPRIGLVVRYDQQRRISDQLVPGSSLGSGSFNVDRVTWGINAALAGGSTLMVNHERWDVPDPLRDVDVIAIRWVAAF